MLVVDVTGGALRAPLGQNASGYLVYRNAHGRQKMAAYSDGSACLLDKGGLVLMTTAPQATLLSPHPGS